MALPATRIYPSGTVLDAGGAPFAPSAVAHQAASLNMPGLSSWLPPGGSADADLLGELDLMRRRSRDSTRNHPILTGTDQTYLDHIVGSNLLPVPRPNWRALGRDRKWAREWQKQVVSLWDPYARSAAIDASAIQTHRGLAGLILRGAFGNGDGCVIPRWKPNRPGTKWATCFLVVESDRLSNPNGEADSDRLRGGVEIDADGAPLAYWLQKGHPGDAYLGGSSIWSNFFDRRRKAGPGGIYSTGNLVAGEWIRIPAKTPWGRRRFIHCFDQQRAGQHRGKPIYSAVLPMFKYMDKYMQVEMQAAIINAMIALFVETPLGTDGLLELFGGDDGALAKLDEYRNAQRAALQTGAGIYSLYPGEKVTAHHANRPAGTFPPVMESLYALIGAGLSMPPQHLLKDFRKANFASARMAIGEAYKFYKGRRNWLVDFALQPMYECWLEEAVSKGEVEAPGFYEKREHYVCADWIGEGPAPVEPKKDAEAVNIRRSSGQTTFAQELAAQGKRAHEHIEELADEAEMLNEAGLGHLAAAASAAAPAEPGDKEDDEEKYDDGSDGGDGDLEDEE